MELIRKVAEECDLVHGFQLIHSVSGGAGGGFGSLLIDQLREEYSDRIRTSFSVLPALAMSQVVVRRRQRGETIARFLWRLNLTIPS